MSIFSLPEMYKVLRIPNAQILHNPNLRATSIFSCSVNDQQKLEYITSVVSFK